MIRRDLDADPISHLDGRLLPTVRPASAPARAAGVPDEIGIDDVEIVRAEGLALGPEQRQTAMRAALASIPAIVSKAAPRRAA